MAPRNMEEPLLREVHLPGSPWQLGEERITWLGEVGMRIRTWPFLSTIAFLCQTLCSGAFIQLTGAWKDLHHGLPNFASYILPFRGVRSVFYLKALRTLSCFLPLFHSQALIPTEPLALLILPQHVLPRPPEWTQVGSRSGL